MSSNGADIRIISDFEDYYDIASSSSDNAYVYNRVRPIESRSKALKFLRDKGISTLDIKLVREFDDSAEKLVVYTDPYLHDCKGKHLVDLNHAKQIYGSLLASKYHDEANGEALKFLQVGSRRFRLRMKINIENNVLTEGEILAITELNPGFNYSIMCPIFSIDYVSNGDSIIATDFNRVQRLDKLGIDKLMAPSEVISEIKKALLAYNKLK